MYGRINMCACGDGDRTEKRFIPAECRYMAVSAMLLLHHVKIVDAEDMTMWTTMLKYLETYACETADILEPPQAVDFAYYDVDGNNERCYYAWQDSKEAAAVAEQEIGEDRTRDISADANEVIEETSDVEEIPASVFMQVARRGGRGGW